MSRPDVGHATAVRVIIDVAAYDWFGFTTAGKLSRLFSDMAQVCAISLPVGGPGDKVVHSTTHPVILRVHLASPLEVVMTATVATPALVALLRVLQDWSARRVIAMAEARSVSALADLRVAFLKKAERALEAGELTPAWYENVIRLAKDDNSLLAAARLSEVLDEVESVDG